MFPQGVTFGVGIYNTWLKSRALVNTNGHTVHVYKWSYSACVQMVIQYMCTNGHTVHVYK